MTRVEYRRAAALLRAEVPRDPLALAALEVEIRRLRAYAARVSEISTADFSSWTTVSGGSWDPLVVAAREAEIRALREELIARVAVVRRLRSSTACNFHGDATGCCQGHCLELRLLTGWCDLLLVEKRRAREVLDRLVGSTASAGGQ